MSESAARMAAYGEFLKTYRGNRQRHQPGTTGCDSVDHCYTHHVDEPAPGSANVYRECGECFHVFVTEEDLQREDVNARTRVWQAGLGVGGMPTADHSGAPTGRPGSDIDSCPLCAHDF